MLGVGRLPAAGKGLDEFRRVFVDQMGLTLADGGRLHFAPLFSFIYFHVQLLLLVLIRLVTLTRVRLVSVKRTLIHLIRIL